MTNATVAHVDYFLTSFLQKVRFVRKKLENFEAAFSLISLMLFLKPTELYKNPYK